MAQPEHSGESWPKIIEEFETTGRPGNRTFRSLSAFTSGSDAQEVTVAHTSCFRMPQSAPPDPPQAALSAVALGKAGQSTRRAPNGGDTEKVHPAKAWASPCWAGSVA